ncbi:MAG TPA: alpha-D-ribose 1-methylphosphonate 5-triphosphate diphosphatase [Candidatus Avimonoglobus intestinipullorum]|uniref:Alpha-D-ribose 1-methylphosphonate 5-triphosphate diphosphatase n=1 Tax=Candidatus Avimonoglobus intestinipullorum TaxID=2840699 RepID=A0A9D1LUQ9_9FIRM|nr:alpha-D-ribose 1-methylphosphonate 5-triphosphate diphosphatase [Candidatus Avimonoglobus intestinipullorum]
MQDILIKNAAVVLKDRVLGSASVLIQGHQIGEISENPDFAERFTQAKQIDAAGAYLMPGFIDIHSDNIETVIQPRPQSMIDFELAMREQEKQPVNQGITTMYHSLSVLDLGIKNDQNLFKKGMVRTPENLKRLVGLIRTFHEGDHLIRHRFHCRYDITNTNGYDMVLDFIRNGDMQLLSFMDHTPGQGQYRDLELFKNHVLSPQQNDAEKEEILSARMSRAKITAEQMTRAADMAAQAGIPIASHDDDSIEKLDYVTQKLHASICEFPVELAVAKEAHRRGMQVVVGATNVLMGRSHSNNLSALEAIQNGCADILVSDYFPAAILHAVFQLHERGVLTLPDAVNMATYNPAKAVGLSGRLGSIEPGKYADLLLVSKKGAVPVILSVFINGEEVTKIHYRNDFIGEDGARYD